MKLKIGTLLLAGTALVLSGCGYKDDPVPPQEVVPKTIQDLRYQLEDGTVKLSWTYPAETIAGGAIDDISNFELYRTGVPVDEYCSSCPIPFGKPQSLPGGPVLDGETRRVASFEAGGLKSGYRYFFKVTSGTGWWAMSADSNIVSFIFAEPPAAPARIEAVADDSSVQVRWSKVASLENGAALLGDVQYEVLRNGTKVAGPLTATTFVDTKVKNGSKYSYAVQAIMPFEGETVMGAPSKTVAVTPVDKVAPDAVSGVKVVAAGNVVKIFWNRSGASDLKEYRVYRRAHNSNQYSQIGTVAAEFTIFDDQKADNTIRYYYVITAVDATGNESARSKAATTRD